MKGKFGIAALLLSSITFAAPVSTPNPNLSDTPIISGGGNVSGGGTCRGYQTNGTAVPLSGGETLVFYSSGGGNVRYELASFGGYLSTKSNYSGTAYVRMKLSQYLWADLRSSCLFYWKCPGSAIGLFARNTDDKNDFIAGAGAGGGGYRSCQDSCGYHYGESGGGWGSGDINIYSGYWFRNIGRVWDEWRTPGFHGPDNSIAGAASSVSAYYNSYTKDYTSLGNSFTISGGGFWGQATPTLYVCQ
jgi:hypothetical protein